MCIRDRDWEPWNTSKLDPEPEPTPEPKPEKKFTLSRGAKGGIAAACAGVVLVAALAASGLLGGGTDPVVLPDDSTPTQSQTVITGGEKDPQVEDSSRLDPNALFQPDSFDETEDSQDEDSNGDADQSPNGETETGQEPTPPPSSNPQATAPEGGQTQSGTPDPEPEPEPEPEPTVPTKAELEAQVESYLDANQFAEAAEVYRQLNTLGYVSREKLGSSLVEVGADAEYYWSETDFGNNNSPYVKTAFDLYTEAAGLGCAQAYAKLAYCYDYGHYVSQDPAQACHWWTQMANTGDGPACYFVAEYYAEGNGVPQDIPTAISWLNKCLEYGASYVESDARALLTELQGN